MKKNWLIVILLALPLLIGTVTSQHYSKEIEAVTEDRIPNPEESLNIRNSVDNYSEEIINENNNVISTERVMTNESEESISDPEGLINSGEYGTSSWEFFSDGSLYIGSGEFPSSWVEPSWWGLSPKKVIIEGPIVLGHYVAGGDANEATKGLFNSKSIESIIGLTYLDTSNVLDMSYMFYSTQLSELDVSGFDTSNVTDMYAMFTNMNQLSSLDVSGFDTSNVTSMGYMFYGTQLIELDASGFDTSNVTSMPGIFGEMMQLRTLVLGTKSIWSNSARLPESVSEGYWVGEKTGTIFNSSSDFMSNYTGEFPDVYTREQEFLFDFSDDEENAVATITGYVGSKTKIDIPNIAINYSMGWTREIPVVSVGDRAFHEKKLNSVTLPASIESIGTEAFADNNIETVEFPEELTSIGESAFQMNSLIELNIPDKVYEIGNKAFAENSSLSQVTLGDGIKKIGSGMFISAPLKTIEVSEEYLEKYRALLNSDVMIAAVVESPVLQVFGEDRYIDGTNLEMNIDYGDVLELGVISKKKYQMGKAYVWNTFTPSVQWYKNSKALADEVNRIFTINQVQEEDSGNYHAVVEETILEPITVNVSPVINPDIPPIDPTDSNPISPENPNPAIEALSLRFVSDIDFNEINVSNSDQRIYSKPTIDMNGQKIPNMVTVQDTRTVDKRDNWNLTVKQSGELMNGARIIMTPYSHSQNKEMFGITISNPVLVITSDCQSFAATDNSKNAGIFSLGMHEPEAQGVQLEIPANAAVGQYSTTVIWNLVIAP